MMRSLFGGRRRSVFGQGRELGVYRNEVFERTARIDARLADVADDIDALRRRDLEPDETVDRLSIHETELDTESEQMESGQQPSQCHDAPFYGLRRGRGSTGVGSSNQISTVWPSTPRGAVQTRSGLPASQV